MRLGRLAAELRRRKVFRTAGWYLIGSWLILQVANVTFEPIGLPAWTETLLVWTVIIGFPVTLLLGWRYELGPRGLVLTQPRASADQAEVSLRGADYFILTMVAMIVIVASYGLVDRLGTGQSDGRDELIAAHTAAVLPFVNQSMDPDDILRSDGLSDELRDQLAQVEGLRIAHRTSSVIFRDQSVDMPTVANRLGVAFLIAGRLTESTIIAQLVDGRSGFVIWSNPYDRSTYDLLAIQREIASEVVTYILPEAQESTVAASSNVSAHERLLLARQYEQQVRDQLVVDGIKLNRAIELYREAIALDPGSALAHARLAGALLYLGDVEAAEPEIFLALSLDPNLSEIKYTETLYYLRRNLTGVATVYRRAIELNPHNADALTGYAQWIWGHSNVDEAEQYFRRALEIDPLSLARYADFAEYLGATNRKEQLLELAEEIRARFPSARGYTALARLHELMGDLDVGIAWGLKALDLAPEDPDAAGQIAELYARIGDFESAARYEPDPGLGQLYLQRRYPELISLAEELVIEQPQNVDVWYLLAFAYNAIGRFDLAVNALAATGLPEFDPETRLAADEQAMMTLVDATQALGDEEQARAWARIVAEHHQLSVATGAGSAWWPNTYLACALAVLGREQEALDALERIKESLGLVWSPLLNDARCFQRLQDDPRYLSVVEHVEERKAQLRARLPETLREHKLL